MPKRSEAYNIIDSSIARNLSLQNEEAFQEKQTKAVFTIGRRSLYVTLVSFLLLALSAITVTLFAGIIATRIEIETLEKESKRIQTMIDDAKSENTRLQNMLYGITSQDKIQEYAEDVLGMQKIDRYQIRFFDTDETDKAVVVAGKEVK